MIQKMGHRHGWSLVVDRVFHRDCGYYRAMTENLRRRADIRIISSILLAMGLGSFASLSVAQGLTERIVADIVRTDESPVIDGLLDDAA